MSNFTFVAQNVNGDPFASGNNINITNSSFSELTFIDVDDLLGVTQVGEFVSFDGGTTQYSYEYLGSGDVRGDPLQGAAFIRVDMGDGTFQTFAIDLNADGDRQPNLQNGNTGIKVADLDSTTPVTFPPPPCFVSGTMILTASGERPVEALRVGDKIQTADSGAQPIIWAGNRTVLGRGQNAPVRVKAGAIGNPRALLVSPQHRLLVSGWKAELNWGVPEVLVPACRLVDGQNIVAAPCDRVTYHHILLKDHHLVSSNGCWSESFFPGPTILTGNPKLARELALVERIFGLPKRLARPTIERSDARLLAAA